MPDIYVIVEITSRTRWLTEKERVNIMLNAKLNTTVAHHSFTGASSSARALLAGHGVEDCLQGYNKLASTPSGSNPIQPKSWQKNLNN